MLPKNFNNCFFWAHVAFMKMRAAWYLSGRPMNHVPVIYSRPSDNEPYSTNHWLVAYLDRSTSTLSEIRSFKPVTPVVSTWWTAWTRLLFRGEVKYGDKFEDH